MRFNPGRKAKKIADAIRQRVGHDEFEVWYEPVNGPCMEMQGYAGGWFVEGDDIGLTPLGYNITMAMEAITLFFRCNKERTMTHDDEVQQLSDMAAEATERGE